MYRASDGYPLQYRHWRPAGSPRGIVIALHGIQSHGGWYQYSCRRLAEEGYEVFFLDRRGSGLNARERGHAPHEDRLIADVRQFLLGLKWERRNAPHCPLTLMGVSWGGRLAAACAASHPQDFDGLALLYPGLYPRQRPTWRQRYQLEWAASAGWGTYSVPIQLNDPALFSDSPAWQEFIRRDELALHRVTVDFLRANLRLGPRIEQRAANIRGPVLMMLAGKDRIIDNAANRAWLQRLNRTTTTRLIEYPDACHTLEFEPRPEKFVGDLLSWLGDVVTKQSPSHRDR